MTIKQIIGFAISALGPLSNLLILFVITFSYGKGMEPLDMEMERCCIKAYRGDGKLKSVGVKGVSYLLRPIDGNADQYLSLQNGRLQFSQEINEQSLFSFEEIPGPEKGANDTPSFHLMNLNSKTPLKSNYKDKCFLDLVGKNKLLLNFEEFERDRQPFLLQYDLSTNETALTHYPSKPQSHLWALTPAYQILEPDPKNIDPDTLLFKISKKEEVSGRDLSFDQVRGLYALRYPHQPLMLAYESDGFFFSYTPQLPYINGIHISASDFPFVKVFNVSNFWKGIGDSLENAKEREAFDREESVEIRVGQTLFLRPNYTRGQMVNMGLIEITPGVQGITQKLVGALGYHSATYHNTRIMLRDLIHNAKEFTLFGNFATVFKNNHLSFMDTAKSPLVNPGPSLKAFDAIARQSADELGVVAQNSIEALGNNASRVVDRLAVSIENLGHNIEQASLNASQAWVESSRNLSEALVYSATTLQNTIIFASKTFENSVKFLSLKATDISKDINDNTQTITRNLQTTAQLLNDALVEASRNLADGSSDAADALRVSSTSFERAFRGISMAIEHGTDNIGHSIQHASTNFVEGMAKIETAARALKNTSHKVSVCSIS